jgi:hypothetical protein
LEQVENTRVVVRRIFQVKLVCALLVAVSANAATSLDVQIPSASTTSVAFNVTVTARNGASTDTAYRGTVHFSSDDPAAVLPSNYTFTPADAGTHTFSATMNHAGSGVSTANHTITATDVSNAAVNGTDLTTVRWNDGAVRVFFISAPAVADRAVPFQIEVQALNAGHSLVTSYTGTVHFTTLRQETLPPDYTFTPSDGGIHTFSVTATLGNYSLFAVHDVNDSSASGAPFNPIAVRCPELVATATNSGPVCSGSQAMLFGSANLPVIDYHWISAAGHPLVFDSHQQNPIVNPGMYILTVRQSNECEAETQTFVGTDYPERPEVTLSTGLLCGSGHLQATLAMPSEYSGIHWSAAGGTIVSGQGTPSVEIAPDSGSTHIALSLQAVELSSGCDASGIIADVPVGGSTITAISTLPASCAQVTQNASVADGGSGAVYAWTITHATITGGAGTRSIQYVADGTGDVTLGATVTNGGCQAIGSAVVSITAKPDIMLQPQGASIGSGSSATLTVAAAGSGLRYRWYEGHSGDRTKLVSSSFEPSFNTPVLTSTTSYWAEVENDCGIDESRAAVVAVANAKRRAVAH